MFSTTSKHLRSVILPLRTPSPRTGLLNAGQIWEGALYWREIGICSNKCDDCKEMNE
jgi:hypothetical protein